MVPARSPNAGGRSLTARRVGSPAPDRHQELGGGGIHLDLGAQSPYMDIHDALVAEVAALPDGLEKARATDDAARRVGKRAQQTVFRDGHGNGVLTAAHQSSAAVQHQRPVLGVDDDMVVSEDATATRLGGLRRSARSRAPTSLTWNGFVT